MLQISVSKSKCFHESEALHFKKIDLDDLKDIIPHITKENYPWSPNIFSDEYRHGVSFCRCDLLGLDYDTGTPTLIDIITRLNKSDLAFIVGTTKSHQKEKTCKKSKKTLPPLDRFRVILKVEGFADNIIQFNNQIKRLANKLDGIDTSCSEGARFFWPCREIIAHRDGKSLKAPRKIQKEKLKSRIKQIKQSELLLGKSGWLPSELIVFFKTGTHVGDRRPCLFKYGARLTRLGWPENKVIDVLLSAPFDKSDLEYKDMLRQVKRGIAYGKSEEGYSI